MYFKLLILLLFTFAGYSQNKIIVGCPGLWKLSSEDYIIKQREFYQLPNVSKIGFCEDYKVIEFTFNKPLDKRERDNFLMLLEKSLAPLRFYMKDEKEISVKNCKYIK